MPKIRQSKGIENRGIYTFHVSHETRAVIQSLQQQLTASWNPKATIDDVLDHAEMWTRYHLKNEADNYPIVIRDRMRRTHVHRLSTKADVNVNRRQNEDERMLTDFVYAHIQDYGAPFTDVSSTEYITHTLYWLCIHIQTDSYTEDYEAAKASFEDLQTTEI